MPIPNDRTRVRPKNAAVRNRARSPRFAVLLATFLLGLSGCTQLAPMPTPSGGGTTTTTAETSAPPIPVPGTTRASENFRFQYSCSFINGAPQMSFYRLESVWASGDYTRISSCTVNYLGPTTYEPSPEEARVIVLAGADARGSEALDAYLNLARLCTRISDEAGPDGFAAQTDAVLEAAGQLCPRAPQAKIIAAWADGERFGDGSHIVGTEVVAGRYALVRPAGDQCQWTVTTAGETKQAGGASQGASGVDLTNGSNFVSVNCGIWWKME